MLAPADLFWGADSLMEEFRRTCVQLQELGGLDAQPALDELHFGTQPVRKSRAMIREFIGDVGASYQAGESLILMSSSLGRAERVQELLLEHDIPVRLCGHGHPGAGPEPAAPAVAAGPVTLGVGDLNPADSAFRNRD